MRACVCCPAAIARPIQCFGGFPSSLVQLYLIAMSVHTSSGAVNTKKPVSRPGTAENPSRDALRRPGTLPQHLCEPGTTQTSARVSSSNRAGSKHLRHPYHGTLDGPGHLRAISRQYPSAHSERPSSPDPRPCETGAGP